MTLSELLSKSMTKVNNVWVFIEYLERKNQPYDVGGVNIALDNNILLVKNVLFSSYSKYFHQNRTKNLYGLCTYFLKCFTKYVV